MRFTLFCLPKGKKKKPCLLKGKSHFSLLALLQLIICYLMQLFIWLCMEPPSLPSPSNLTKSHTSSTSQSHHWFLSCPKVCPFTAHFMICLLFLLLLIQTDSNHIHLTADTDLKVSGHALTCTQVGCTRKGWHWRCSVWNKCLCNLLVHFIQ